MTTNVHFAPPTEQEFNPSDRSHQFFEAPEKADGIIAGLKAILATPTYTDGVDMSHWNRERDWEKIKNSGIDFVILKATEGTSFKDETFDESWRGALDNDLMVMPYHFFRSNLGGAPQAKWCIDNILDYLMVVGGSPIIWADVETADGAGISQRQNRLLNFCLTVQGSLFQAGYYSSPYLWNSLIGNVNWANDYWQWVAHWTSASAPQLPVGWSRTKTKFWQYGIYPTYSWAKPVEGAGTVDVNRFYGTVQELHDLLGFTNPPADCCDELRAEVTRLDGEIRFLKGEVAYLNQALEPIKSDIKGLDEDMAEIDTLRNEIARILQV